MPPSEAKEFSSIELHKITFYFSFVPGQRLHAGHSKDCNLFCFLFPWQLTLSASS
jgi:hypothetical protein